jgi:uncharacterized Rmd1/YagE family protein
MIEQRNTSLKRCVSYCTASGYDLAELAEFFHKKYHTKVNKDLVHLTNPSKNIDVFFFVHGCFVSWGLSRQQEQKIISQVVAFANNPLTKIETDVFSYTIGDKLSIDNDERLKTDLISLDNDNPLLKLAFSYAIAQSTKLETFEAALQDAIRVNSSLPQEIATHGVISLTRRAIFKRIGEIFLTRSSINLNSEYLDVPDFFWRHPNFEAIFITTKKFLDIPSRVIALNQKLDVLQELLHILNSQVQQRHSNLLESIIIILIVIEIMISIIKW